MENAIERAATLCDGNVIQLRDLPPTLVPPSSATGASEAGAGDIAELPATAGPSAKTSTGDNLPALAAASTGPAAANASLKDFLREQELNYLNRVLAQNGGDKEKAAIQLGVSLATLYRKLSEDEKL